MTRLTALAVGLVFSTSVTVAALAAAERASDDGHARHGSRDAIGRVAGVDVLTVADSDHHRRRPHHAEGRRHQSRDDDDDRDDVDRSRGMPPRADANDPARTVPGNGLFKSGTRPKVEVQ